LLIGPIKSNGHQNYKNWDTMMGYHPRKEDACVKVTIDVYELNDEFYKTSDGIFDPMSHYEEMFEK
jgi:hypothetical protein